MKPNILIFLWILCVSSFVANGQNATNPQNLNLIQYMQQLANLPNNSPEKYFHNADSVMNILHSGDSTEAGPMSSYQRFKAFYQSRMKPSFENEPLTQAYVDALRTARNRGVICGEHNYKGNWENIGPRTDNQNYQNQGMVTAIWSKPTDPNYILIGSEAGGLWNSTNGGVDWNNLTDLTELDGTMGIQSFTVNPDNYDDIYLATRIPAKSPYDGEVKGMGIWHSIDGGSTWTLETNGLTDANRINAQAIQFSPYKVNNESYVVATIGEHVFAKKGAGAWMDLTPSLIQPPRLGWLKYRQFTDIEFMPDRQGKFLIANEWDDPIGVGIL